MPTILITGAASGIGRASALLFATRGWRCVLVDCNATALAQLMQTLSATKSGGNVTHLVRTIDLTQATQIHSLADPSLILDAIINNAGMSDTSGQQLVDQDPVHLNRLVALNLRAPAQVVQALLPQLAPGARVVNVASGAALRAIPWRGAYSATKAGLLAQTQALAAARPDLAVSVLCPGVVRTELVAELIDIGRLEPADIVAKIPLGRMADPQEMAEALFFLASEAAGPLSGERFSVDGGSSVFGGSKPFKPAELPPLPPDSLVAYRAAGNPDAAWVAALAIEEATPVNAHYTATLDFSCLHAKAGQMLHTVHEAARRYAGQNAAHSSLTVLLPAHDQTESWQQAGDIAAVRMLIASLACELGPRAMRVNAIEMDLAAAPSELVPLLRFVAGPRAQFLTGQTIRAHAT